MSLPPESELTPWKEKWIDASRKRTKRQLKLCGIAERRLHDARHTAATLMYSQGVGIETISRALGHSSSAITSRLYVHSAEEPLKVAARAMQQVLV